MTESGKLETRREVESSHNPAANTEALDRWLEELLSGGGSDLLLIANAPPSMRVNGEVKSIEKRLLDGNEIEAAVLPALTPHGLESYRNAKIADSSYVNRSGRFRINLHRERGNAAATIRALPSKVPILAELRLPAQVEALSRVQRGLVLIGGPAGSGKSTTMAALVHEINRREARHIITIEDPVEYEHTNIKSLVEQVEIGTDAPDFPTALRASLRQAPDVIVVGEMRDPETMRIAMVAAETGHLVFSTMHTTDVSSTVSRIGDSFPLERQNTIRQEMAMALTAILTQALLPTRRGGLVPAAELLVLGYGARQHIRRNMLQHLHQEITITRKKGSLTMEESLARLVMEGHVDRDTAFLHAGHPDDLESLLKSGNAF